MRYSNEMARTEEHLAELMKLPAPERVQAANALFDSLDGEEDDAEWEACWARELVQRVEGVKSGEREAIDSETARARVLERLRSVRR